MIRLSSCGDRFYKALEVIPVQWQISFGVIGHVPKGPNPTQTLNQKGKKNSLVKTPNLQTVTSTSHLRPLQHKTRSIFLGMLSESNQGP